MGRLKGRTGSCYVATNAAAPTAAVRRSVGDPVSRAAVSGGKPSAGGASLRPARCEYLLLADKKSK